MGETGVPAEGTEVTAVATTATTCERRPAGPAVNADAFGDTFAQQEISNEARQRERKHTRLRGRRKRRRLIGRDEPLPRVSMKTEFVFCGITQVTRSVVCVSYGKRIATTTLELRLLRHYLEAYLVKCRAWRHFWIRPFCIRPFFNVLYHCYDFEGVRNLDRAISFHVPVLRRDGRTSFFPDRPEGYYEILP
eukprot:scaffold62087_cov25-Attheya_sp.AAC.1